LQAVWGAARHARPYKIAGKWDGEQKPLYLRYRDEPAAL
jgi:hypothetical protein